MRTKLYLLLSSYQLVFTITIIRLILLHLRLSVDIIPVNPHHYESPTPHLFSLALLCPLPCPASGWSPLGDIGSLTAPSFAWLVCHQEDGRSWLCQGRGLPPGWQPHCPNPQGPLAAAPTREADGQELRDRPVRSQPTPAAGRASSAASTGSASQAVTNTALSPVLFCLHAPPLQDLGVLLATEGRAAGAAPPILSKYATSSALAVHGGGYREGGLLTPTPTPRAAAADS